MYKFMILFCFLFAGFSMQAQKVKDFPAEVEFKIKKQGSGFIILGGPSRRLKIDKITDSSGLKKLKIKNGTVLEGRFKAKSVSAGGLRGSRIIMGDYIIMIGELRGEKVGCPPLCNETVRLGIRVNT
ncbi:MAG: hypothetical protein AAFO94_19975 [Bacteroidota bacterium]